MHLVGITYQIITMHGPMNVKYGTDFLCENQKPSFSLFVRLLVSHMFIIIFRTTHDQNARLVTNLIRYHIEDGVI